MSGLCPPLGLMRFNAALTAEGLAVWMSSVLPMICYAWYELDLGGGSSLQVMKWELLAESKGVHRILNNANLQGETGMYYMTDDWTKVQARFPRSPLRNRTVGSMGGRQASLLEYV